MRVDVLWGLVLGLFVGALGFVLATAGMHKSATAPMVFILIATVANIVAVVIALRATRANTGYGGQVLNALRVGLVASVLIFVSSWFMTAIVFPDYYSEMIAATRDALEASGTPAEQIREQMALYESGATPVASALQGVVGTLITSLVVGLLAAAVLRRRNPTGPGNVANVTPAAAGASIAATDSASGRSNKKSGDELDSDAGTATDPIDGGAGSGGIDGGA